MRRFAAFALVLALFFGGSCLAASIDFPSLTGRVVDQAGLLSSDAKGQLTQQLAAHEQKTGQQVVVAIVSSLQGQTIEDYGYRLGRTWGIGQKDKDTGVILLVAPHERKVRIEVGYGLEGTLTDAKSADIIHDTILPAFKQGEMQQGIVAGTSAILVTLGGDPMPIDNAAAVNAMSSRMSSTTNTPLDKFMGVYLLVFLFIVVMAIMLRGMSFFGLLGLASSGWGKGISSSSSFSSDDGGFSGGGGSFGGGGASGSW